MLKTIIMQGDVTKEELDALAATIELAKLPSLQTVDVSNIRNDGTCCFAKIFKAALVLPCMQVLHLPLYKLSVTELEALADGLENRSNCQSLPGLRELTKVIRAVDRNCKLGGRILKACLPTLEKMNESSSSYHSESFLGQCFAASPPRALKELILSCACLHTGAFIPLFNAFKAGVAPLLERLEITGGEMKHHIVDSICQAMEQGAFSKLQELKLEGGNMEAHSLIKILGAMTRSPHRFQQLTSLCLDRNWFGTEGVRALSSFLQAGLCPSLQKLSLYDCLLRNDEGLMSFVAALDYGMPCSNSLRMLNLKWCGLTKRGVKALFRVMVRKGALPNIEELYLSCNDKIKDKGVATILKGLERGAAPKLKTLDFSGMGMTYVGAALLGKAFAAENILPISLQKNKIVSSDWWWQDDDVGTEGRDAIRKGLQEGGWLKRPGFACEGL